MNESPIDQLYCTHCTYGTSALYRAEDARKDQVFEYSTRAASVDQNRTHQLFQLVELYIKFQLPGDTPASEILRYTADTSPWQRLAYFPAISGSRVLTRSCYRQTDTRNRPGSYFAHVLLSESVKTAPAWSAIDGLKLWGAPGWTAEDSPDLSFELPQAAPLADWPGFAGAINDEVLLSFLNTEPGGPFPLAVTDDPDSVIPVRWRTKSRIERRQLLIDALGTVMQLNPERHEKLMIAVEPGLAALLFYGVLRLLPARGFVDKVSFSTYQSHLENPATTLTACSFFNPDVADLLPDAYRGAAINTFNGKRGQGVRSAQYASATYLVESWAKDERSRTAVDSLLAAAVRVGAAQPREFEELIATDRLVGRLLTPDPKAPLGERELPTSKVSRQHLQQSVTEELANLPSGSPRWQALLVAPGQALLLIRLLGAADASAASQAVAERICRQLRPDEIRQLLTAAGIADELKTSVLASFFLEKGALPPGCDFIWDSQPPAGAPRDLPVRLLKRFDAGARNRLLKSLVRDFDSQSPDEADFDRYKTAVRALLASTVEHEAVICVQEVLWPPACDERFVAALLQDAELRERALRAFPVDDPVLCPLVERILDELPKRPSQFRSQLNILKGVERFLDPVRKNEFLAWNSITGLLTRLGQNLKQPVSWLQKIAGGQSKASVLDAERDDLAKWVQTALPDKRFPEDYGGTERAALVAGIARVWLAPAELPADFVGKVAAALGGEQAVAPPQEFFTPPQEAVSQPQESFSLPQQSFPPPQESFPAPPQSDFVPAVSTMAQKRSSTRSSSTGKQVKIVLGAALVVMLAAGGYYLAPKAREIYKLAMSSKDADSDDAQNKKGEKPPKAKRVAPEESEPEDVPARKTPIAKAKPILDGPKITELDAGTSTADKGDDPGGDLPAAELAANTPAGEKQMPAEMPVDTGAKGADNKNAGAGSRESQEPLIDQHSLGIVIPHIFPLKDLYSDAQVLGCPRDARRVTLHGPLVGFHSPKAPSGFSLLQLEESSSDSYRKIITMQQSGGEKPRQIADVDIYNDPSIQIRLREDDQTKLAALASLRTCALQIHYKDGHAYYYSFAPGSAESSGHFSSSSMVGLPPVAQSAAKLFSSDDHFLVARNAKFVFTDKTKDLIALGEPDHFHRYLHFPDGFAATVGYSKLDIRLPNKDGKILVTGDAIPTQETGEPQSESAARIKRIEAKWNHLDSALWEIGKNYLSLTQKPNQAFPIKKFVYVNTMTLVVPDNQLRQLLSEAHNKAAALVKEIEPSKVQLPDVPQFPKEVKTDVDQANWDIKLSNWFDHWRQEADKLKVQKKKRIEELTKAVAKENNGSIGEKPAKLSGCLTGELWGVIDGVLKKDNENILEKGIVIELVRFIDDTPKLERAESKPDK